MPDEQWLQLGLGPAEAAALGADRATRIRTFRLILVVAQQLRARMDERLRTDGLTTQQAVLITVIAALGRPSLSEAAATLGTTHQNAKQVAAALERKGFVRFVADRNDRRVRRLVVTARSRKYWQRRDPVDFQQVFEWFDGHDGEEMTRLFQLLARVAERLRTPRPEH
jgi:DNA-binding MarR family transcriptional regulator